MREVQGAAGGFNYVGQGSFAGFPWDPQNFETQDTKTPFPYDRAQGTDADTNASDNYTALSGHQRGRGRPDVSGKVHTPSKAYQTTWTNEATGANISPNWQGGTSTLTPRGARDAGPVLDVNGDPLTEPQIPDRVQGNIGPADQWDAGVIPGLHPSPGLGDDPNNPERSKWKPPEENKMNLREFFDPETPPTETVQPDDAKHEKDQTDDEVENKVDQIYGQEDNHDFDGGKESNDDSTQMDANGHMGPPGSPDQEAEEARDNAAPGAVPEPGSGAAGMVMLDNEPAGIISLGDEMGGGPEEPGEGMEMGGPPKATVDAQDWQLTVEPEAGQMPTLSSMMGGGQPGDPVPDVGGMTQAAKGLLPQQDSSWNTMDIQVGDAVISLSKQPPMPPMPPQLGPPPPPMMESAWAKLLKKSNKRK